MVTVPIVSGNFIISPWRHLERHTGIKLPGTNLQTLIAGMEAWNEKLTNLNLI